MQISRLSSGKSFIGKRKKLNDCNRQYWVNVAESFPDGEIYEGAISDRGKHRASVPCIRFVSSNLRCPAPLY